MGWDKNDQESFDSYFYSGLSKTRKNANLAPMAGRLSIGSLLKEAGEEDGRIFWDADLRDSMEVIDPEYPYPLPISYAEPRITWTLADDAKFRREFRAINCGWTLHDNFASREDARELEADARMRAGEYNTPADNRVRRLILQYVNEQKGNGLMPTFVSLYGSNKNRIASMYFGASGNIDPGQLRQRVSGIIGELMEEGYVSIEDSRIALTQKGELMLKAYKKEAQ
ncbi:MAG: hypothetical protein HY367_02390 [Candidatus Aenigmarchaeota archaeon]|nr:hypothetical protein [Candidatus Aenigmarchaeota archaeon]